MSKETFVMVGILLIFLCILILSSIFFIPKVQIRWNIFALTAITGIGSLLMGIFKKSGK